MTNPTVTAVIPARGGSKGLPRKNVLPLGGKPLLAWSIEAALSSKLITQIIVTTDDADIKAAASKYNVTLHDRPAHLASDTAQNLDVVLDLLNTMPGKPDIVVLLQPTSPLRTGADIDACIQKLINDQSLQSVTTVCECEQHPAKAMTMQGDSLEPFMSWKEAEARRQDLPHVYRQNGAVYAVRVPAFIQNRRFLVAPVAGHLMPHDRSIDIDTQTDFARAEKAAS